MAAALAGVLAAACAGGSPETRGAAGTGVLPEGPVRWDEAPAYADLFAPVAHRPAYRFFTSPHPIELLLPRLAAEPASLQTPGGWTARPLLAFEAFGQSGSYDRSRLVRLYGARRAQVARGPRQQDGRVVESWTLVSPYPDPGLSRLEPGTLLIVLRLP